MKVALDQNIPSAMVKVFQAFATSRQLRKLIGDFEIKSAADYAPKPGEPDHLRNNDVPWLKRFAEDGGKVVITGDTSMKNVPHERKALVELGFVVIFFESKWSNWPFCSKCALLLHWWPVVARTIRRSRPGFWHIPANWAVEKGKLRKVSSEDPKRLKFEKQQKARVRKRRLKAKQAASPATPGLLALMGLDDEKDSTGSKAKATEKAQ